MSIIVTCLCGKQFRVPDEAAGNKMSCPVCANFALVPRLKIGKSEIADHLPAAGQYKCVDCQEPFWPDQLVNDRGELVCTNCYDNGPPKPPRKPIPAKVKNAMLVTGAVLLLIALNAGMAYFFFMTDR